MNFPTSGTPPLVVPLTEVSTSGIFDQGGAQFQFGILQFSISGTWMGDNFGVNPCTSISGLCDGDSLILRMENYKGTLRTDAVW